MPIPSRASRTFKRDLDQYALANRGRLVSAAITIIKAYFASNELIEVTPFNSFGDWSRMIREPLIWLGEEDPCSTRSRISKRDPVAQSLGNFLEVWESRFGSEGVTAGAALSAINSLDSDNPECMEALCNITGDGRMPNARQLGKYLTRFEGRIERGRKMAQDGTRHRAVVWKLINISNLKKNEGVSLRVSALKGQSHTENLQENNIVSLDANHSGQLEPSTRKLTNSHGGNLPENSEDELEPDRAGGRIIL